MGKTIRLLWNTYYYDEKLVEAIIRYRYEKLRIEVKNMDLQQTADTGSIANFVKGQGNRWLGYILKREKNDLLKAVFEWTPQRKPVGD